MSVQRGAAIPSPAPTALEGEARLQALLTPPRQSFFRRNEAWIVTLASLVVVFGAWEAVMQLGIVRQTLLAGPSQIIGALIKLASTGQLWKHSSYSAINFLLGFGVAAAVGIPLGLALGTQRRLAMALNPYLMALYSIPRIAFISLLIVWFGLGMQPKVILIFLSGFFPIVINTWAGVKVVDPVLVRAGRSYGAKGWQLFRRVIIPFSIPFIMAGLRLGVGRAVVGVFASELFGSDIGIGYLILTSGFNFKMPEMFAGVVVLAVIGVGSTELIAYAEKRLAPWRQRG